MVALRDRFRVARDRALLLAEPRIDISLGRRRVLFAPQFPQRRYAGLETRSGSERTPTRVECGRIRDIGTKGGTERIRDVSVQARVDRIRRKDHAGQRGIARAVARQSCIRRRTENVWNSGADLAAAQSGRVRYAFVSRASGCAAKSVCSLSGGRRRAKTRRGKSDSARSTEVTRLDAECDLSWTRRFAAGGEFPKRHGARVAPSDAGRHRRTVSTNRHASSFRRCRSARRNRGAPFMDPRDGGAAVARMGDRTDHSAFAFLWSHHRPACFQYSRGGDELDSARWLFLRAKSVRIEQSGSGRIFSSFLEHGRILLDWISAFVRGCGWNYFIG